MTKKVLFFMAFVAMMVGGAFAQSSFTLKLGASFPQGKFGEGDKNRWGLSSNDKRGGAGTGFSVGGEWVKAVSGVEGLGVLFSVDAIYNGLNSDIKDAVDELEEELEDDNSISDYSIYKPSYINIPLMVGLNYSYALNGTLSVFGNAGIGANVRIITPAVEEYVYENESAEAEYKYTNSFTPAVTLSWRIGVGMKVNDKFSISLEYYVLGDSKVKGKYESTSYYSTTGNHSENSYDFKYGKINPTMLLLRLGIYL